MSIPLAYVLCEDNMELVDGDEISYGKRDFRVSQVDLTSDAKASQFPRIKPNHIYFIDDSRRFRAYSSQLVQDEIISYWCAEQLNKNVKEHDDVHGVEDWEKDPRCFPLRNFPTENTVDPSPNPLRTFSQQHHPATFTFLFNCSAHQCKSRDKTFPANA
ncbi:hypothetical protein H5410_028963 [Solanum commersonii]|uniref:DUF295 domain-containing protein n=1 Tax=Solanum commersonii TaxID=4109 RepID=A0A9J5Z6E7_SOLCO|nr:hypothetical protein H5410_028963 [Solanum commersonii]